MFTFTHSEQRLNNETSCSPHVPTFQPDKSQRDTLGGIPFTVERDVEHKKYLAFPNDYDHKLYCGIAHVGGFGMTSKYSQRLPLVRRKHGSVVGAAIL